MASYPISDSQIGFVYKSYSSYYFYTNDIYEGRSGYTTMTYKEFKELYNTKESPRYWWLRDGISIYK